LQLDRRVAGIFRTNQVKDATMQSYLIGTVILYIAIAVALGVMGGAKWVGLFVIASPILILLPVFLYSAHCGDCIYGVWVVPIAWLFVAFCNYGSRRRNTILQSTPSQTPSDA
jgi:hypothetical protein